MYLLNPDHPIVLSGVQAACCLDQPFAPQERVYLLDIGGQRHHLAEAIVVRGDSHGVHRIYRGAMTARAHVQYDLKALEGTGFTAAWSGHLAHNAETMHALWLGRKEAEALVEVGRHGDLSPIEETDALLGQALQLGRAGGLGWALSIPYADRQSAEDREIALRQFNAKVKVKEIRAALVRLGVSEATLQRLFDLAGPVHREIGLRAERQAQLSQDNQPLRLWKGIVLGDLVMLASTAKVKLPEPRREYYQLSALLDLPERRPEPTTPTPQPPAPVITPTPPAGPATPTLALPMSTAEAVVPPLAVKWPAGTIVYAAPAANGPAIHLVAQGDGTLTWVPAAPVIAPTTAVAPPPPAASLSQPPPPAPPRRKSRR